MKGTIHDFLKLAAEDTALANDLADLATKHGFVFSDELGDDELSTVSGGGGLEADVGGSLGEAAAAEKEQEEQRVAAQASHINSLMSMLSDMRKISGLGYDATHLFG